MKQTKNQKRVFGLDLMRAIAIIMVLVGHCAWIFPDGNTIVTALLALSSFMGVEIFFVLSGFLIGRILYRQFMGEDFSFKSVLSFLKRRWFRTFPNYFLILIVNIIVAAAVGSQMESVWKYFFFLQNFATPMLPFFTESWSLSVEEFAYVVLPLALLAAFLVFRKSKSVVFLLTALLLVVVFVFTKYGYHIQTANTTIEQWNLAVKSVVIYRLDSIFIGVIAGWIYSNFERFWIKTKLFWLLSGLLMMAFFTFGVGWFQLLIDQHPFFWNVVYLPLVSISIAFFLPVLSEWKSAVPLLREPVTFISLISYSVYLLHYSIILQTMKYCFDTESLSATGALFFTFSYLAITMLLSYILFRFYEKPMTDKRDASKFTVI